MKNILVTGGCGFIGSHTVVELVSAGYNPIIIDNFSNSAKSVLGGIEKITDRKIRLYTGDFQDVALLKEIITSERIEGVIHFAAYKAVGESMQNPLNYYQNNVSGFIALLQVLKELSIKNIVFSSSCTVYGEPDKLPVTENSEVKPAESPYGTTKQIDEIILRDSTNAQKLHAIALRYFNPIGAHPSGLIGELPIGTPANLVPFVTQTAAGIRKELTIYGDDYPTPDGTCIRDYIHVVDLAKAHIKALEYIANQESDHFYDVINVGTGKGNSVLDVINTFEKVNNTNVSYKIGSRRNGDIVSTFADVTKAKEKLHWQTEKTLADALKDAWNWQQNLNQKSN
jgi:UDP-glucose 4-epimerase